MESESISDVSLSSSEQKEGGALYVILAIASPLVYSLVNVVDKTAVSTRVKHTPSYMSIIGIFDMVIACIIACCCDWSAEAMKDTKPMDFIVPIISAFCWAGSIYCYYMGMLLTDASVIVGFEYLYPLIVVILSAIFLHERIKPLGYVGCVMLVIGAVSLSLNLIGFVWKKCCKSKKAAAKRGPFPKAVIPASQCASINDKETDDEARAAFSAVLNWRGDFVMPVMEDGKTRRVNDSYVDMEAGCAPGVQCWFPCLTWCRSCKKVADTKAESSAKDDKADDATQTTTTTTTTTAAGGRTIDSRKSLESSRNARVRVASRAAVKATVDRPTPEYDDVVADEKSTSEAIASEDAKGEDKKKKKKKSKKSKHPKSEHKDEELHSSSSEGEDESASESSDSQTSSSSSSSSSSEQQEEEEEEETSEPNAIPLTEMSGDKTPDQLESGKSPAVEEDEGAELSKKHRKHKKRLPNGEERNCITIIVAWCTRHKTSKGLLMLVLIPLTVLLALTEFLAKVATASLNTFNVCSINFFAFGFFMFCIVFVTPLKGFKYFVSEFKRNWIFCIISDVLTLSAQFLLIFAMSGMSASVVSSLAAIQPFGTLMLERVFGVASDNFKECVTYKVFPVILIVAGVVILSVAAI